MQEKHLKNLEPFKMLSGYGIGFGVILVLFSIFADGYNILLGLGIGLATASVVLFLCGTFLGLMEEYTARSRVQPENAALSKSFRKPAR